MRKGCLRQSHLKGQATLHNSRHMIRLNSALLLRVSNFRVSSMPCWCNGGGDGRGRGRQVCEAEIEPTDL
jgi:hypothetical protein